MKAEILSIGNELLNGTTLNTNANWLADRLVRTGVSPEKIVTVGDDREGILKELAGAAGQVEVLISTGGLGPTHDDITKEVVAEFLGTELVEDESLKRHIMSLFQRRGVDMPEVNLEQARVPGGVALIPNPIGTAPGFRFERKNTHYFILPGVPAEMKRMTEESVLPFLREHFGERLGFVLSQTIRTTGIFESRLYELLQPISDIQALAELAFLPHRFGVDIRLTAKAARKTEAEQKLWAAQDLILPKISEFVYEVGDRSLEEVVADLLFRTEKTVAVAESCTAGLVSHLLTNISGSSAYLLGSVVSYSNEVKHGLLGVPAETLEREGAVSESTARQMAEGVRRVIGTDFGVATTGIAGPTGGTEEKPVGLVYVACSGPLGTEVRRHVFHRDRLINKYRFAYAALNLLRQHLIGLAGQEKISP